LIKRPASSITNGLGSFDASLTTNASPVPTFVIIIDPLVTSIPEVLMTTLPMTLIDGVYISELIMEVFTVLLPIRRAVVFKETFAPAFTRGDNTDGTDRDSEFKVELTEELPTDIEAVVNVAVFIDGEFGSMITIDEVFACSFAYPDENGSVIIAKVDAFSIEELPPSPI